MASENSIGSYTVTKITNAVIVHITTVLINSSIVLARFHLILIFRKTVVIKELPSSAQVVVVGAGIIGCSITYRLTKLGIHELECR